MGYWLRSLASDGVLQMERTSRNEITDFNHYRIPFQKS
jgi:hypothetical protein